MKRLWIILLSGLVFITFCEKQTTDSPAESHIKADLVQLGGCQGSGLLKRASEDCFTYTFGEQLILDFCVTGNCCPDTNRFEMEYIVENDQIAIAVTDTAENLCRCNCQYLIHAEFSDLPETAYQIKISMTGPVETLLYDETVHQ